MKTLAEVQAAVLEKCRKYRGKDLTEQDTKNALIEPVLDVLGWPKGDLERVRAEFRQTAGANPVDYALFSGGRPVMFVEAKALDQNIEDPRFVAQVLSYANVAGVDWALLTNGYQWDLFSVFARVQASQKRFFTRTLDQEDFPALLGWLTPERLAGNELERIWHKVVVERGVRSTINRLVTQRSEKLIALLADEAALNATDVALALQALQPVFKGSSIGEPPPLLPSPELTTKETELVPPGPLPGIIEPKPPAPRPKGRFTPPPNGAKPTSLTLQGQHIVVKSWREVLSASVSHVHRRFPTKYEEIFVAPVFEGKKDRRTFARTKERMRMGVEIPGGYMETNLSGSNIVAVVGRLLDHCGVPPAEASFTYGVPPDTVAVDPDPSEA